MHLDFPFVIPNCLYIILFNRRDSKNNNTAATPDMTTNSRKKS